MNSCASILQCANPQELAQKQLQSQTKKKHINQKYYQKKKQEFEELDKLKVQLGVKQVDFGVIQNALTAKDQMISSLQIDNQRKEEEYTILFRQKDAEMERMRIELDNEIRDNSRERIIRDLGQQIGLMNERLGKLELCENRVKKLEARLQDYEGRSFFLDRLQLWYPNEIANTILRLQQERLLTPLKPPSLDKLIADSRPILHNQQSPAPIPQRQ
jgi:hypothetical protein